MKNQKKKIRQNASTAENMATTVIDVGHQSALKRESKFMIPAKGDREIFKGGTIVPKNYIKIALNSIMS